MPEMRNRHTRELPGGLSFKFSICWQVQNALNTQASTGSPNRSDCIGKVIGPNIFTEAVKPRCFLLSRAALQSCRVFGAIVASTQAVFDALDVDSESFTKIFLIGLNPRKDKEGCLKVMIP